MSQADKRGAICNQDGLVYAPKCNEPLLNLAGLQGTASFLEYPKESLTPFEARGCPGHADNVMSPEHAAKSLQHGRRLQNNIDYVIVEIRLERQVTFRQKRRQFGRVPLPFVRASENNLFDFLSDRRGVRIRQR